MTFNGIEMGVAPSGPKLLELEPEAPILVTGAAGFIGRRVVELLLERGFTNIRCFVRPSSEIEPLQEAISKHPRAVIQVGNLLSPEDCARAAADAVLIFHLVTGRGKSFPGCFLNSVVTTRNLLDAVVAAKSLRRFVNISSFAVHSNLKLRRGTVFDETCPLEDDLERRYDAYVYGKLKQDEIVAEYHRTHGLPYVTVRPSVVIGPGKEGIPAHVGLGTFGIFLHVGGRNAIPFTYVDNCAEAIILAGLVEGVEGEVFQVVDDDLPTSRFFLRQYRKKVRGFRSLRVPYPFFYLFCALWEKYARWSAEQLPPAFNRRLCAFYWKGHDYSNRKLKERLGWNPRVPMDEALSRYFHEQRRDLSNA
jgi:nucleoside-diphosphate-sugar epimerase